MRVYVSVSVSAGTLKRIPYTRVSVRFTLAETLTAVMFPQLVNSEDTQCNYPLSSRNNECGNSV